MNARGPFTQDLLEKEAVAWRDLAPADYDRALCGMLDDISAAPHSADRSAALVTLTSATLRRDGPTLTESRACGAEHLLALIAAISEPALLLRIRLLFLLVWLRLGAVVEHGPESISVTPGLPPGVVLPEGADPAAIGDPALREQAREAAVRHGEAVERWNAKQRALGHLHRLAALVRTARPTFKDDENATKELLAAMSLVPGVPCALRRSLEDDAG
jgi:hypothetical protein